MTNMLILNVPPAGDLPQNKVREGSSESYNLFDLTLKCLSIFPLLSLDYRSVGERESSRVRQGKHLFSGTSSW